MVGFFLPYLFIYLISSSVALDERKQSECATRCADSANDLQCGEDGVFYKNKCEVDCFGTRMGIVGEHCPKQYWTCSKKCENEPLTIPLLCGDDGHSYPNVCTMECLGRKPGRKELCEKLELLSSCRVKCQQEGRRSCGDDGHWYGNDCVRECFGIREGEDGKECLPLSKVEQCEDECNAADDNIQCGKDERMYLNDCEMKCHGIERGAMENCNSPI